MSDNRWIAQVAFQMDRISSEEFERLLLKGDGVVQWWYENTSAFLEEVPS